MHKATLPGVNVTQATLVLLVRAKISLFPDSVTLALSKVYFYDALKRLN